MPSQCSESTRHPISPQDREWIEARAHAAGFDLAGITGVPDSGSGAAEEAQHRFAAFVDAGRAGEMDYLKQTDAAGNYLRGDLRRTLPWARSVIVCAVNYNADAPLSIAPADPKSGWIARYAWSGRGGSKSGADYHDVLKPPLLRLEAELRQRFGDATQSRCYVDTGPIVERGFAAQAGIGWIGRNTCVIHQQQGSWLLLGVIVTSLELAPESVSMPAVDRCGTCTRCIDACPTDALLPDRQMDASRCIAYLTIEKKGSIAEDLRAPMGRQLFGCDICQDVCPWNRKAPIAATNKLPARRELINPALDWLAGLDGVAFNRLFRGSPVQRTRREVSRRKRFLRNIAIAMGNSGETDFLPQLQTWSLGDDSVLAESAQWAIQQLTASR